MYGWIKSFRLCLHEQIFPNARQSLALRLAQEVQAILQIEKLPFDMTPDVFLEGVYAGYQTEQERFES